MRLHRTAALTIVAMTLAGCIGASAQPSSAGTSPSEPIELPSASETVSLPPASVDAVPSDELGPFSCDLPVVEAATVALANITDVRVGTHASYDRVVFEFADGLPELTLDRATPPFTHDASGMPVEVTGDSFLRLTMRGVTKQTAEGTSSYDGPTDFDPAFPSLVDLVEGGDFEAQSTWYLGLAGEPCPRVMLLSDDGPPRLVIDVEHSEQAR